MTLTPGTRLGPYEILSKLGEGGMGEVWRATDSKLRREVAIKVLPSAFTEDAERLGRFQREAQLLAQLQHPHIASVYGLEESGDVLALVMELVDGPTLDERVQSGALPIEECLEVARQVAEALEDAHDKGIVHRDLKPQNIKAPVQGKVKVLDFGLAKAMDPAGEASGEDSAARIAQSPTLTMGATMQGVILGTAAYMAPEQAKGQAVDKRADIWAFGVVLYEMLTGRSLFAGDSVPDTLARVLQREIDFDALPKSTPPAIRRLLRRCLARNPKQRLHAIADARIVIDEVLAGEGLEPAIQSPPARSPWARLAPWVLIVALAAALAMQLTGRDDVAGPPSMTVLPLDLGAESISLAYGAGAVLSRDGSRMAWVTNEGAIVVRDLDSTEARRLPGTEEAQDPVFSPDGSQLAFFGGNGLFKVPVGGGRPVRLAEVALPRGVTWTDDDFIIFNRDVAEGLWRVPAGGGTPERLTAPSAEKNERSHRWPHVVPGTRKLLFLAQLFGERYEEATIEMLDLDSGQRTVIHRGGSYPRAAGDGVLLYARDRGLWAAALDLDAGKLAGQPVRVLDEISYSDWSGGAQFDVAGNGSLIYSLGRSDEAVRIAWFDPEDGSFETVVDEPGFYYEPKLAPDGRTVALQLYTVGRSDLWLFDLVSGSRRRLTFGGRDQYPVFSPDGLRIAYSRIEEGSSRSIAIVRSDGAGEPVPVAASTTQRFPSSWSQDGTLLFTELSPETHADIWTVWPDRPDRAPEPFLATPANESEAVFSPDGDWVVFESDESGREEIYVRPYPGPGGRWQISESGGSQPLWGPGGRAVYFWSREGLVRREVREDAGALIPGASETFDVARPARRTAAIGKDGRILLVPFAGDREERARTLLVLDWSSELEARLGAVR